MNSWGGEGILFPVEQRTSKPTTELNYSRVRRCVFLSIRARRLVFETHTPSLTFCLMPTSAPEGSDRIRSEWKLISSSAPCRLPGALNECSGAAVSRTHLHFTTSVIPALSEVWTSRFGRADWLFFWTVFLSMQTLGCGCFWTSFSHAFIHPLSSRHVFNFHQQ